MDKQALTHAIVNSGGKQGPLDEVDGLWAKLDYLQQTGRYGLLLSQISRTNDKNNFLALVLEANFAHQFESQGLELVYEVKQTPQSQSSIDFLRKSASGNSVYFELRLLQQTQRIADSIKSQLQSNQIYRVALHGDDQKNEVIRIQNTILSKVQDKLGNPIKFFGTTSDSVNIIVVDATISILGAIDVHDCMLAIHGDASVHEIYRRNIFGLFQTAEAEDPQCIQNLAAKYERMRNSIDGVLFVFKKPGTGIIDYLLEQYLIWNPARIDAARARPIYDEIKTAIPIRQKGLNSKRIL